MQSSKLSKPIITTKGGDKGYSRVYGGKRLRKDDLVFEALGSLDELSSLLGVLIAKASDEGLKETLSLIQRDLYKIMAFIAGKRDEDLSLEARINFFEREINKVSQKSEVLNRFVLPQGSELTAFFHFARAVARRAERRVVRVEKNEQVLKYLNRLSDFLFAKTLEMGKGVYV